MLKMKVIFIATIMALCFPVYAQSDSNDNLTYVQKAQKMLDQANAQAAKQFDKNYPKPTAPVIQNPASPETPASGYKPPVAAQKAPPAPKNDTAVTSNSETQQVVNPPPDINVNTGKSGPQKPQNNIFMPSGSSAADANNSAPNPYR